MTTIHPDIIARYDAICAVHEPRIENDFDTNLEYIPGTSLKHLRWMLREIPILEKTDVLKAHRWIAFVQTVLIMAGFTNVQKERDFTRPYFSKVDNANTSSN